jgi:tetratricopeptide (TPR) repeat protein
VLGDQVTDAGGPSEVQLIISQAAELAQAGQLPTAEARLNEAIQSHPSDTRLRAALAVVLRASGNIDQAIASWRTAIALEPHSAEAHYDLALTLESLGRITEAIPLLRRTIDLEPDFPDSYLHLAADLQQQAGGAPAQEPIALCRRAVEIDPENPDAHQLLGAFLVGRRDLDEAERHLLEAIRLADDAEDPGAMRRVTYGNLGVAYACRNRFDEALKAYGRVLELDPSNAEAHWNRSQLLLTLGDFRRGWEEYEWRWHCEPQKSARRQLNVPEWNGGDPDGRTILVHAEQGLGDTIQFCRYVPLLAARGARVLFLCPSELRTLMASLQGVSELLGDASALPTFDLHAPLLSLPRLFGTMSNAQLPERTPYLHADPQRVEEWKQRLGKVRCFRVGFVWAGNPGHVNDAARSLALAQFAPLAVLCDKVQFLSLQKGPRAAQTASAPLPLTDLAPELHDFADTAALLQHLDLLITADTAAAHLAGALGRPVWCLIPFRPDWRWQIGRDDSPWYPTMRLFRQPTIGDWASVIERITRELASKVAVPLPRPPGASPTASALGLKHRDVSASSPPSVRAALTLRAEGKLSEAADECRRLLASEPENPDAAQALGVVLTELGALNEAERSLHEALRLANRATHPTEHRLAALRNLGAILARQNRVQEAITIYEKVLALAPDLARVHGNLAHLYLATRQFERGWREFEWRWRYPPLADQIPSFPAPPWDDSPLGSRTLLLYHEQGLGDTIQFARFAESIAAANPSARILLYCQPPLHSLLRTLDGVAAVLTHGDALPPFDVHAPLLSTPRLLGMRTEADIPNKIPYLKADPARIEAWQRSLSAVPATKRIALTWAGSSGHSNDRERSIPLSHFAPLAQFKGITLISLQKDAAATQLAFSPLKVIDLAPRLTDFAEIAALLSTLDLLITADTAVAHLAGALGLPVWLLVAFRSDWRWQLDRTDSPWYPSMRIFRQLSIGDWDGVMSQVVAELVKREDVKT